MRARAVALVLTTVVVAAVALTVTERAHACSCAPISMEQAFRQSDAAIIGRLLEVVPVDGYQARFIYRVKQVYKGRRVIEEGEKLSVRSGTQESACGLPQRQGRKYGLFLNGRPRHWTSNLCSVTSPERMRRAGEERNGGGKLAC